MTKFTREKRLTLRRAKQLLDYDPVSGLFRWKVDRRVAKTGDVAGFINDEGYVLICIDYVVVRAHRLAWLFVNGRWPKDELDHKDLVRHHNWIGNLREGSQSLNNANRRAYANNRCGYKGVYRHQGRWRAMIRVGGKGYHIGSYDRPEEAHQAYVARAREIFGEFANAGR